MALFGKSRDISLFRHINKELLGDIITQQVAYYKFKLEETKTNIYGETPSGKMLTKPTLLNCLIQRNNNTNSSDDFGPTYSRTLQFSFLRDDLVDAVIIPEIGDIVLYQEDYYELESIVENQLFIGKNPNYPYTLNPLNENLDEFGYSVSINCIGHYIPADKIALSKER